MSSPDKGKGTKVEQKERRRSAQMVTFLHSKGHISAVSSPETPRGSFADHRNSLHLLAFAIPRKSNNCDEWQVALEMKTT